MKTGIAYAFADYGSGRRVLARLLAINAAWANFPDTLKFTVLSSEGRRAQGSAGKDLPAGIAAAAETTDVFVQAPMSRLRYVMHGNPKKAADLKYLVIAVAPEVTDSEFPGPLGKTRANRASAAMLNEALGILCHKAYQPGRRTLLRSAVFYQDSRGNALRY